MNKPEILRRLQRTVRLTTAVALLLGLVSSTARWTKDTPLPAIALGIGIGGLCLFLIGAYAKPPITARMAFVATILVVGGAVSMHFDMRPASSYMALTSGAVLTVFAILNGAGWWEFPRKWP